MYTRKSVTKRETTSTPAKQQTKSDDTATLQRKSADQNAESLTHLIQNSAVQTKLTVGNPHDRYEQEADQVAQKVMTSPLALVQRASDEQEKKPAVQPQISALQRQAEEKKEDVQTKPDNSMLQRQAEDEKEEPLQTASLQRQAEEKKKEVQTKPDNSTLQRQAEEEKEEPVQAALQTSVLQRQSEEKKEEVQTLQAQEEEKKEPVQTKASTTPTVTPGVESQIQSMKGGGQPLPKSARAFMEPHFDQDFNQVRVHTNSQAAGAARKLNAQAFTSGQDIYFGDGRYQPDTSQGKSLLAHELTHVVQQQKAGTTLQRKGQKPPQSKTVFQKTTYKRYLIKAKTLKEAADAMQNRGGQEAGACEWFPSLNYQFDEKGIITKATVQVKITVTMPKWPGAAKLSKTARAEWKRFYKALERHEQGHVKLVHKKLRGLAESLVGQSEADAKAAYQKAVDALQKASHDFDTETDHGRNQGTTLDLNAEQ